MTGAFLRLWTFSFVTFLSAFQLFPAMPFRIMELGGTKAEAGIFLALYTWACAASAPFTGAAADHFGRRRALLLGSCERRKEVSAEVGTYFLTEGWLEHETNLWAEHQAAIRKWGAERAERLRARMLAHYGRLAVVETGAYDLPAFVERTRLIAEALKLEHAVVPGSLRFLGKLLTGPWDEEFLSLAPGETVTVERIFGPPAATARPGGDGLAPEG